MQYQEVDVIICGKKYSLRTTDSLLYTKNLAKMLDQKFQEAFSADRRLSLFDAAVLVSMELLDIQEKGDESVGTLRSQLKEYSDEVASLRTSLEKKSKEAQTQKEELDKLATELEMLRLKSSIDET